MLDFSNLTAEQRAFFNEMWERHQAQREQSDDSVTMLNAYLEKNRQREDSQAKAAEALKAKMV
ncbi:MAG: hypothetical protein IJM66_12145 [Muribaculaceae bacterium]|nr:hypothetical protein [Muribaculaceae bacterium]